MTATSAIATVCDLLAALKDWAPTVEDGDLVFALDPPAELEPALLILHTGVRAALTRRAWHGCDGDTGRVRELNPAAPIPPGVTLLCVAGDACWDRIHPAARLDQPHLFALTGTAGPSRRRSSPGPHQEPSGGGTELVAP
jgi:hypothetical protein